MLFSEKLKKLRKEYNLTQEDLSSKLNVSRQAITKWECNEGLPDIDNLKQISILFNVSIDELIKDDLNVNIESKYEFNFIKELEIDHIKHFDIDVCKNYELNLKSNNEEKIKIELLSNEDKIEERYKIIFDDSYNNIDINIKSKSDKDIINLYIPEKYIDDIELNSKSKIFNISNLQYNKIEYDGELKYLNVNNSKGNLVLNTSKCDVEANYDKFDGRLEINLINSVARVTLPKDSEYKTIKEGIKNEFIDSKNIEESENIIELNGLNSKLIIIEK